MKAVRIVLNAACDGALEFASPNAKRRRMKQNSPIRALTSHRPD
ncbi:hypothetical protein PAMC26577_37615 [Caballeronia sordidicola]|uniref:Uncharacterized protein n=1 Tax=Caballeronia sordidicola TaxID=196367 RepID=A0A242M6F8_CABSO|nr:hypothetical protein PAMC26577_37615 [Caballeronia sordidicola]